MQLLVVREKPLSAGLPYTHGKLYAINGGHKAFICYTIEDTLGCILVGGMRMGRRYGGTSMWGTSYACAGRLKNA